MLRQSKCHNRCKNWQKTGTTQIQAPAKGFKDLCYIPVLRQASLTLPVQTEMWSEKNMDRLSNNRALGKDVQKALQLSCCRSRQTRLKVTQHNMQIFASLCFFSWLFSPHIANVLPQFDGSFVEYFDQSLRPKDIIVQLETNLKLNDTVSVNTFKILA